MTRGFVPARFSKAAIAVVCALTLAMLPACGGGGSSSGGSGGGGGGAGGGGGSAGGGSASGAAFSVPANVTVSVTDGPGIDTSHTSEGYVSAAASSGSRLKFQIAKGDMTYNYDLPNDGTSTVFPINMGNGSYNFRIMQNTSESNYVELDATSADVTLSNEFDPYLIPSIFCDYSASSACVSKAKEVAGSASNVGEAVQAVCTWVAENVSYDTAKAEKLSQSTGYIPNPDSTLSSKTGICFDYASLSAAMLRSLGIPTKIITGYVGSDQLYHSWIMVYIDGSWQSVGFSVTPNTWSRCDVTFASTGSTQYTGDASSYTDKYTY